MITTTRSSSVAHDHHQHGIITQEEKEKEKKEVVVKNAWTAPEVLRGEEMIKESDVYSFGVVVWELVMNQTPWHGREGKWMMNGTTYTK